MAAGLAHTCALTPASGVKCWGDGLQGQLGDGTGENRTEPVDVIGVTGAIALAAAAEHTCALIDTGAVKCWGKDFGLTAVAVPSITNARVLAANGGHTCVVTATGGVKCWGLNSSGQLGNGSTESSTEPVDVVGLESGVLTVAAGYTHSCAITIAGPIKCWGSNDQGKLGGGSSVGAFSTTPIDVAGVFQDFVYIVAGENHTCASRYYFIVRCWGDNSLGQLGNGDDMDHSTPVGLTSYTGAMGLYAGSSHTCTVDHFGDIYCWGYNADGQIGNGQNVDSKRPVLIGAIGGKASILALGGRHTCVLMATGLRKCWGDNSASQYGDGLDQSVNTPLGVANLTIPVFGKATAQLTANAGTHSVTASYRDGNYDPSSSAELVWVVLPGSTTLTLTSSPNPSTFGQQVTFTAAVAFGTFVKGTMELWKGSERLAVSPFENVVSFPIANLPVGTHDITATATFDGNNYVPASPASVQQTVVRAPTRTTLTASPRVVGLQKPVILVAQVVEGIANDPISGSVTFKHNNTILGTAAVVNGLAQLNAGIWPIGSYSFTASYSGSETLEPSTGLGSATVDPMAGAPAESSVNNTALHGSFTSPAVARLSNNRFVLLMSVQAFPVSNSGTYFQIYRPDGLPVGPLTGVVPTLIGQNEPSIGAAGNGFVIVFTFKPHRQPAQIWGMRISALGALLGEPFKINTTDQDYIQAQQIAGLKDGGFVVVWSAGPDKEDSGEIYAQRYDSNGRKVSGEFVVNTTRRGTQAFPAVAALPNGGFVVAWSSEGSDGNSDIHGQRYAANGAKAGMEIKITSVAGKSEDAPSIAAFHGGGFVVAWTGDPTATVYGRRFAATGLPKGAVFVVGQRNYGWSEPLALAVLDDDRFLIGYSKSGQDIYARLYGPTAASGSEFRVNAVSSASIRHMYPAAVALSDRSVLTTWEKAPGPTGVQIQLRRLNLPAGP